MNSIESIIFVVEIEVSIWSKLKKVDIAYELEVNG